MFLVFTLSAWLLAIVNSHLLEWIDTETVHQIGFFLLLGMMTGHTSKMKDRGVLDIMFIWSAWVLGTDLLLNFAPDYVLDYVPLLTAIESVIFIVWASRVYLKSYAHFSQPFDMSTVFIAFYGGPNSPFLSRLSAHIGYPFSSVAMIAGDIAVRPSKAAGKMVEVPLHILQSKGYVFINTKVPVTTEVMEAMESVIGTPTGYKFFRYKCLINLMPVLELLGPGWIPKKIGMLPSRFYAQCVRNVV